MNQVQDTLPMKITDMLCFDVYAVNQAFGQVYKALLEPLDLTYPQYLVLITLWSKDCQSVGEIGNQIGLESSTLTPLIKRLEKKALVTRLRDKMDERRVIVSLTKQGQALEVKASAIPDCVAEATGLSHDEFATLHILLNRTQHSLLNKD